MTERDGPVLGGKVRHYRKLRGMTQEELAEKVGVAPAHIANIERGNKGASVEVLRHICRHLQIGMADVLPGEGDDSDLRERLIAEVTGVMNALDTERLRVVREIVGALK